MTPANLAAIEALRQSRDKLIERTRKEIEARFNPLINAVIEADQREEEAR